MFNEVFMTAQSTAGASAGSGIIGVLGPIVIFGIMIFLLFRAQRKEAKKRKDMLSSLKTGDKVVTGGGIFGEVTAVKDDGLVVKIADGVKIKVIRSGISSIRNESEGREPEK
jgi:preprotein translocase subunit YajC